MQKNIFKDKKKVKKKDIKQKIKNIDETTELIPIYFGPVFKKIFQNHRLLKNFLIIELNLDKKLKKQNVYYGSSVLINKYGPFVVKTSFIIKVCNSKPLIITFATTDYQKPHLKNRLIELTINYNEKYKFKNIKIINKTKKEIKYYRKLYNRKIYIEKKHLLLVALTSNTFMELYEIISKVFDEDDTNLLINAAAKASKNKKIINDWKIYRYKKHIGK